LWFLQFERATRTPLIFRVPPSLLGKDGMAAHEAARGADGVVRSMALVEFVDIMPSLIDLAGLAMPEVCPPDASKTKLCREGVSLKPVLAAPATTEDFRPAAFMQYPTCMHDEGVGWHNACADSATVGGSPHVMGYAMRTRRYRYIAWVNFTNIVDNEPTKGHHKGGPPSALFAAPLGIELYDHTEKDTVENVAESINCKYTSV
jgi:hypothetical protein